MSKREEQYKALHSAIRQDKNLSAADIRTLLYLADISVFAGKPKTPALHYLEIAAGAEISQSGVSASLKRLADGGWIARTQGYRSTVCEVRLPGEGFLHGYPAPRSMPSKSARRLGGFNRSTR